MNNLSPEKTKGGNPLGGAMGFAVAAALGATLGLLFAPKKGTEMREDVVKKAQEIANKFNNSRTEIQETVKKIFGEVSEELEKDYVELKGHILAKIHQSGKALDQKKYKDIVNGVIEKFSKAKKWSIQVVKKLEKNWADGWKDLKDSMSKKIEEENKKDNLSK